jgi:hypothetical protein
VQACGHGQVDPVLRPRLVWGSLRERGWHCGTVFATLEGVAPDAIVAGCEHLSVDVELVVPCAGSGLVIGVWLLFWRRAAEAHAWGERVGGGWGVH